MEKNNKSVISDSVYRALMPLTPLLVDEQTGEQFEFTVYMGKGLFEIQTKSIDMKTIFVLNEDTNS